jgi:succinate dehydrogenase flavin-adding protein (antitoxin of CptAB toxin-antitoxin module)
VTLERLKLLLDEEETGDKTLRGFINKYKTDAHLQTFEMFLSAKDRNFLNVIYKEESRQFHMSAKQKLSAKLKRNT